jgi:AraC-like DNA-binding protein
MGGDRTCPDDCLLAVWANMPPTDRKAQRKPIAEQLYKQGFTMEQIATQLGVSHPTIVRDLKGFVHDEQTSRPKGGRPKGSSRVNPGRGRSSGQAQITPAAEAALARAVLDDGKSLEQAAKEVGLKSDMVARFAVAREQGRREAEPIVTRDMLSVSAQQKFDAAIRRHKQELALEFERMVRDETTSRINEIVLPHWKKQIEQASSIYEHRRGIMNKEIFNTIRRALHPDSRNSISDHKLGAAFDSFMALEKYLLDEKDSPTELRGVRLPKTWEEWEEAKRKATAARKAKYAASRSKSGNSVRPR